MDVASKAASITRLMLFLRSSGFTSELVSDKSRNLPSFGSAGVYFRNNIFRLWWDYMVVKQEATFPVMTPLFKDDNHSIGNDRNDINQDKMQTETILNSDMTAQYLPTLQLMGNSLPFAIAQAGSCLKNLSASSGEEDKLLFGDVFSTPMVLHYYCAPGVASNAYDNWLSFRLRWWKQFSRNASSFCTADNSKGNGGPMSSRIEYAFPWGAECVETITNWGDEPIRQQENSSGLSHQVKIARKSVLPSLIECKMNMEVAMMTYLMDSYKDKMESTSKSGKQESRQVLQLHRHLAPYKVAVTTSGVKSNDLTLLSKRWCQELRDKSITVLGTSGPATTLDIQFARNDALGIPYTVILSEKSLDTGLISIRHRDTTLRETLHLGSLKDMIMKHLEPV